MSSQNPFAPPDAPLDNVRAVEASPPLWNPGAAASWSLIFTPAFGALVQMKNWEALGEPGRARTARSWAIATIGLFIGISLLGLLLPSSGALDGLSRGLAIVLLITWYYANGKFQQSYVLEKFGKDYPRKGWGKPLLLALAALVGFMVVMFVLAFAAAMVTGTSSHLELSAPTTR